MRVENGLRLSFGPAAHRPESLSLRFEYDGRSLGITGDTDVCEAQAGFFRKVDLLVSEAAMPDGMKISGHLTPSLAGGLATDSFARHLVLTHFYPECEGADVESQAKRTFAGPVTIAADGMEIPISVRT